MNTATPSARDAARAKMRCPGDSDGWHNWQDVTAHGDTERHYLCANCPAKRVEPRRLADEDPT